MVKNYIINCMNNCITNYVNISFLYKFGSFLIEWIMAVVIMSLILSIFFTFRPFLFLSGPTLTYRISNTEVVNILNNQLKEFNVSDSHMFILDEYYCLYSEYDLKRFIKYTTVNLAYIYRKDIFDCDDFSIVMMAEERKWFNKRRINPECSSVFGIVSGDLRATNVDINVPYYHAANFVITDTYRIIFIEPQNDKYIDLHSNSKIYNLIF